MMQRAQRTRHSDKKRQIRKFHSIFSLIFYFSNVKVRESLHFSPEDLDVLFLVTGEPNLALSLAVRLFCQPFLCLLCIFQLDNLAPFTRQ